MCYSYDGTSCELGPDCFLNHLVCLYITTRRSFIQDQNPAPPQQSSGYTQKLPLTRATSKKQTNNTNTLWAAVRFNILTTRSLTKGISVLTNIELNHTKLALLTTGSPSSWNSMNVCMRTGAVWTTCNHIFTHTYRYYLKAWRYEKVHV